jgi:hypothetical protein
MYLVNEMQNAVYDKKQICINIYAYVVGIGPITKLVIYPAGRTRQVLLILVSSNSSNTSRPNPMYADYMKNSTECLKYV